MPLLLTFATLAALMLTALALLRWHDARADRQEWLRLAALQPSDPGRFNHAMVAELPEPARRFFQFSIEEGARLWTVAEIDMGGQFSLGSKEQPRYQPMQAWQILAAPHGFVWQLELPGALPVSGSDAGHWTRFRLLGLVPVARQGGDDDHTRSAFGRYVAEALLWTPAALLPGPGVEWKALSEHSARVTVRHQGLEQAVDLHVDAQGQPLHVQFMRWSNANAERIYREQPFGAVPSQFQPVQGFRVPMRVEAGNLYGTEAYFPFFQAEVTAFRFPAPPP
ncbi:MAG TPA: hypothetical protein PKM39_04360 [Pseudothauera hydrothermalis]|nr:hypothetical protein [Pseudothauera hydrothermalis]